MSYQFIVSINLDPARSEGGFAGADGFVYMGNYGRWSRELTAAEWVNVANAVYHHEVAHLTYEPTKLSKSRIKQLRGLSQPQYRLRVGDIRVFYDVTETQVQVLAIVTKAEAQSWLDEQGTPSQGRKGSGSSGGEG